MDIKDDININYNVGPIPHNVANSPGFANTILKMREESMKLEQEPPKKDKKEKDSDLVRPDAEWESYNGVDGREPTRLLIHYKCPKCGKYIHEDDIGCVDCRIFFDWRKKAKIKRTISIEWE